MPASKLNSFSASVKFNKFKFFNLGRQPTLLACWGSLANPIAGINPAETYQENVWSLSGAREAFKINCQIVTGLCFFVFCCCLGVAAVAVYMIWVRRCFHFDGVIVVGYINDVLICGGGVTTPHFGVTGSQFERDEFVEKETHDLRFGKNVLADVKGSCPHFCVEDRFPRRHHDFNEFGGFEGVLVN